MEIVVINQYFDYELQKFIVTFKYWTKGECACTATRIKRNFDSEPSDNDLLKSIKK